MTTRRFAFEPGGAVRLEITWKFGFRDLRILLDGKEILALPSASALGGGAEFTFGDNSVLKVKPANTFWPAIEVRLDGRKLERSK